MPTDTNNPTSDTYVTGITKLFWMPTDSGGVPAVVVSKRASDYINSAYTILLGLIFAIVWSLFLTMSRKFWKKSHNPDRKRLLDQILDSAAPTDAVRIMVSHCKREILKMCGRIPKEDFSSPEKKEASSAQGSKDPSSVPESKGASLVQESKDIEPCQVVTRQIPETRSNDNSPNKETTMFSQEEQKGTEESPPVPSAKWNKKWFCWDILFVISTLAMILGNIAVGIVVPPQLSMGTVAPVAKDVIFYPDVARYARTDDNGAGLAKLDSLKAPSALRALGAVEDSDVAARKRVHIKSEIDFGGDSASLDYEYNVTGVDMGLQSDPKLMLMVKGSCSTDYTWLLNSTDDKVDTYRLFGKEIFNVTRQPPEVDLPPMATFQIDQDTAGGPNFSYAMMVNTAGLYSYTSGQDPWYATDPTDNGKIAYQVRRGRPALSCWEDNKWRLNGRDVDVWGLNASALPGLKLHELWRDTVFPLEFGSPRVVTVGRAAGTSALKSASYSSAPSYILDAGASAMSNDLERLVLASWISSGNVLRETTKYKSGDMINFAKAEEGSVEAGAAKFVLQSSDVSALSVRILISVPAILLFLFIVQGTLSWVLRHDKKPKYTEEKPKDMEKVLPP